MVQLHNFWGFLGNHQGLRYCASDLCSTNGIHLVQMVRVQKIRGNETGKLELESLIKQNMVCCWAGVVVDLYPRFLEDFL